MAPDKTPPMGRGHPQTLPLVASGHSIVHRQLSPPPLADHFKHCDEDKINCTH